MPVRLFFVFLCLLLISGCGKDSGSSSSPTFSQIPVNTELGIYGISQNAVTSRDYLYLTVDRSRSVFRNYTFIEYTLDTQQEGAAYKHVSFANSNTKQLIIPIYTEGPHQLAIRGRQKPDTNLEAGEIYNFTVKYQLETVGAGKYIGDRTVYKQPFANFSGMRVELASYDAARSSNTLINGSITLADIAGNGSNFSGSSDVATVNYTPGMSHANVEYRLSSTGEFLRLSGTGYSTFMELLLLQGALSTNVEDRRGDLRLYRSDSGSKLLSAYCSSLKGFSSTSPERQAVITLQSYDNINFFGHLRLWDKNRFRVWTYQVFAYNADMKGLGRASNSLIVWPSISTTPLDDFLLGITPYPSAYQIVNPPNAPLSRQPGFITVEPGLSGNFVITQLHLNFEDIYDAAPGSIGMKASYTPPAQ